MMYANEVTLVGRITKAPELKQVGDGKTVVNFSLAIEREFKNADGSRGVDFVPVVAWRQAAENLAKYVVKGQELKIEGRIQVRSFEVKTGDESHKRQAVEVVANRITFGTKPRAKAQAQAEADDIPA